MKMMSWMFWNLKCYVNLLWYKYVDKSYKYKNMVFNSLYVWYNINSKG